MKHNRIAALLLALVLLAALLTACTEQDPKGTNAAPTLPSLEVPTGSVSEDGTSAQNPALPTVIGPAGSTEATGSAGSNAAAPTPSKEGEGQTPATAPENQPQIQPTQQGNNGTPTPTQKPVVASNDSDEDLPDNDEASNEDLP